MNLYKNNLHILVFLAAMMFTACSSNSGQSQSGGEPSSGTNVSAETSVKPVEKKVEEKKTNTLTKIFDGRKEVDYRDYPETERTEAQAEFNKKKDEIKQKMGESYCADSEDENVSVSGVAEGAFTKPNSKQKAIFYVRCSSGSSHFGVGGIIVFENDKAVSHYVYGENGLDVGLSSITDINKNGVDELVLIDYQVHQGYGGSAISLVEFPEGKFNFIGTTTTFSDNSGAVEDQKKVKADAYEIFVEPGEKPVFYRSVYEKKGDAKDWSLTKKQENFSLEKLEDKYVKNYKKVSE